MSNTETSVLRIALTTVLLSSLVQAYHYIDGPVQKSSKSQEKDFRCPGRYCGRSSLNDTHWSACGKCSRGWRVANNSYSICQECTDTPLVYDWLFLTFHALLVLVLHWMAIDMTAKRRKLTQAVLALHVCAVGEVCLAACLTLILSHPAGSFNVYACRVKRVSDWYTYLHNPNPNYEKTLNCTQEAVYPFYTIIFVFYGLCGLLMLFLRPLLASKLLPGRGRSSIFAALYFLPVLAFVQAVAGGLIYEAFPYVVLIMSLISSAFHFAFKLDQTAKALLINTFKESRSAVILIGHWLLHPFGMIAILQPRHPNAELNTSYFPTLAMVPIPALFYVFTVRYSDPENFASDANPEPRH